MDLYTALSGEMTRAKFRYVQVVAKASPHELIAVCTILGGICGNHERFEYILEIVLPSTEVKEDTLGSECLIFDEQTNLIT